MCKFLPALIVSASIILSVPGPAEARRPTPVPSFVTEGDEPEAIALLAEQELTAPKVDEDLVRQLTRAIFISVNEETLAGGVTLYFLRVEGGKVIALVTSDLSEDDLLQAQSRIVDEDWPTDSIALPGPAFLLGEMIVPVSIYIRTEQPDEEMASLEAASMREEKLFDAARLLSEGRSGFMVAAYPANDPENLAGGGFFMPQD